MPGILYVVATPIGNLEDVTHRAIRILREVSLVAAEDTRRSARLLRHYGIETTTLSLHEHNERRRTPALLARLHAGEDVAYVTDAGTPAISDPGLGLIRAAILAGITVTPVPGPSAVIAALAGSGLDTGEFLFVGFPPARSRDRKQWLAALLDEARTIVLFEAPHRIRATLTEAKAIWGDRQIVVARELTKKHEEWVRGPISTVLEKLQGPRGEFTVVVEGSLQMTEPSRDVPPDEILRHEFGCMTENEALTRRQAISALANRYGIRARDIYSALERSKV